MTDQQHERALALRDAILLVDRQLHSERRQELPFARILVIGARLRDLLAAGADPDVAAAAVIGDFALDLPPERRIPNN